MAELVALDSAWLKAHPLPRHADGVDKNGRGRVLIVGGSAQVPGGVLLSAEAAFRAGAGKVTIATIGSAALAVGLAFPECGVRALPETASGEIAADAADRLAGMLDDVDAILIGPAMTDEDAADALLARLLPLVPMSTLLLLDAAALRVACRHHAILTVRDGATVLTPHAGEMAALIAVDREEVLADPYEATARAANRFGATVMLKGPRSYLMYGYQRLSYAGGGIGLATGGSGDVLAGLIAALAAQGMAPLPASAWGIWLHGEAGRRLAETVGPIGYLARELLPLIPGLMRGAG